jgi:fumarylacetoacetase
MPVMDETHDPDLVSWVESANEPGCEFPIQNLPLAVFRPKRENSPRVGVAIGDRILDLRPWLDGEDLNQYFRLNASQRRDLRREWSVVLRKGSKTRELLAQSECQMCLPARIGDYTDFYASIHHATNVGEMFRPDQPLLPNYKHVPVAYHGRSSSIVVSGTPIVRPKGQLGEGRFGPTQELDYEIELGAFLGPRTNLSQTIPVAEAENHLAGVCLLNDWSARDIQCWEYQPLGPFLAKNFATSISPWIVTTEALEPFRADPPPHDSPPLPYLHSSRTGAFDITVEAWLRSSWRNEPVQLSRSSFKHMYWTLAQMVTHHTSNGCPIREGDLIASGTISGPDRSNRGCLLELTWRGKEPLRLPTGEQRCFLEDGDEVILRAYCEREQFRRIGFGECRGIVQPAL